MKATIASGLGAAALALGMSSASAATKVDVIMFPGGANWPLWVAQEKGFFAANGLEVSLTFTPSSGFLMQNVHSGKFQIGHAAFDNIVAYQEGQGDVELPAPAPDFFAFVGGQVGGVRLMVQPDVKSFADLKGKALGVDAPSTGFAFILRKMLQQGGLAESDYTFERLGNTAARTEALMQGKTPGTIVTSPLDLLPESKGFRRLADSSEAIGPYQSILGLTRRSWARENEGTVVAYVRAYVAALDWMSDPANRDEAIAIYRKNLPAVSEAAARKHWEVLLGGGKDGIERKGRIDMAGVENVLKLRSEFARPQKSLTDPSKYVDESYYRKAVR
jgi:ABC-type nitrate/sulfonate/bicarbonate transport system substrate-binding protein